jgi:hypothetical protein
LAAAVADQGERVPVTPVQPHRIAASFAAAVLGLGVLAGCAGQSTPDGYSDSVERNFVRGCTDNADEDSADFDVASYCQCAYDGLSASDGVDFDRFKEVNEDQIEDPGLLPAEFTEAYDQCQDETGAIRSTPDGSAPDEDSTTSTTEG